MLIDSTLKVKLFAHRADLFGFKEMNLNHIIKRFITNPLLMLKAGVQDYGVFEFQNIVVIPYRPISFEVFADEFEALEKQAIEIASWSASINVKIPVTNTKKQFSDPVIKQLSKAENSLNITAVISLDQVKKITDWLAFETSAIISVFAGRIADTGIDLLPLTSGVVDVMYANPKSELILPSPRELLNISQADQIGCHIIAATNDILKNSHMRAKIWRNIRL